MLEVEEAMFFISNAFREARRIVENVDRVFDPSAQERAFGALGQPGDATRIEHLATRAVDIYDGLLDWAAQLRATPVSDEFIRAVDISSRFVDGPIRQFRDFVARTVIEFDRIPSLLNADTTEPVRIELEWVLEIDEGLEAEFDDELTRLERVFGLDRI